MLPSQTVWSCMEYRAGPGNRSAPSPTPQSPFPARPSGPSTPPPPHPGAAVRHSTLRTGQGDGLQPPASVQPEKRGRDGGHLPAAPGSTSLSANLLQSWLQVAAVRSGAQPGVLSAPAGGRLLCREPHWARTSAWRRRPSSPAASSRARALPAPRRVYPSARGHACLRRLSFLQRPDSGTQGAQLQTAPPRVRSSRGGPRSALGWEQGQRPGAARTPARGTAWGLF